MKKRPAVTFEQVIDTDRQLQSFNLQKCQEAPKVCGEFLLTPVLSALPTPRHRAAYRVFTISLLICL